MVSCFAHSLHFGLERYTRIIVKLSVVSAFYLFVSFFFFGIWSLIAKTMEVFNIKIDEKLKANLYKICRLCGIDHPDMIPIQFNSVCDKNAQTLSDNEPELRDKIQQLLGLMVIILIIIIK